MTTPNTAQAHTAEPKWHYAFDPLDDSGRVMVADEHGSVLAEVQSIKSAQFLIASLNATAGIPDPADALRACREALEAVYNDGRGSEVFPGQGDDHPESSWVVRFRKVEAALAKLKGAA